MEQQQLMVNPSDRFALLTTWVYTGDNIAICNSLHDAASWLHDLMYHETLYPFVTRSKVFDRKTNTILFDYSRTKDGVINNLEDKKMDIQYELFVAHNELELTDMQLVEMGHNKQALIDSALKRIEEGTIIYYTIRENKNAGI